MARTPCPRCRKTRCSSWHGAATSSSTRLLSARGRGASSPATRPRTSWPRSPATRAARCSTRGRSPTWKGSTAVSRTSSAPSTRSVTCPPTLPVTADGGTSACSPPPVRTCSSVTGSAITRRATERAPPRSHAADDAVLLAVGQHLSEAAPLHERVEDALGVLAGEPLADLGQDHVAAHLAAVQGQQLQHDAEQAELQELAAPEALALLHVRAHEMLSGRTEPDQPLRRVDQVQHLRALHRTQHLHEDEVGVAGDLEQVGRAAVGGQVLDEAEHVARLHV